MCHAQFVHYFGVNNHNHKKMIVLRFAQFDCGNLSNHVVTTLGLVAQYGIS